MSEYIEREAALSLVQPDAPEDEKAVVTIATAKKLVRSIVRRTPAADVVPVVHGRWKCHGDCGVTECSACGWSIEEYVGDYAYCPNCGAKMEGGSD